MTFRPTSDTQLGNALHKNPGKYWCADCHLFVLDCGHLVEPLQDAPRVILSNWQILSVAYDRQRLILELEMNTGERFQHFGVPRRVAIGLVQVDDTAKYRKEFIEGTYRSEATIRQRTQRPQAADASMQED
jgi:KTSC domain-containing protein